MNGQNKEEVATNSRRLAEFFFHQKKFGSSFAHLLLTLKLMPEWKTDLNNLFTTTLCVLGKALEADCRYTDLFNCYEQALEIFPEDNELLNNLGAHLFRLGHYKEAQLYFEKCLRINANHLPALRNSQNVKNALVERWHFRMLNDSVRNENYLKAIAKKINEGFPSVLDIGTGTGLLSLYAKKSRAENVYACDYSETMISIADQVIRANFGDSECIKLIHKLSNDIVIPRDIPQRLSFVVTETVDAGLLGENILQTVIHAWEHLLLPRIEGDNVIKRVIPSSATLYVSLIECGFIAKKNYVFRGTSMRGDVNALEALQLKGVRVVTRHEEPYDSENLKKISGGFRALSDSFETFTFDFNDPDHLKNIFRGAGSERRFTLTSKSNGYIDAIIAWFTLQLDDTTALSTSPFDNIEGCWDQAVFPIQNVTPVKEGDCINVCISCEEGVLKATIDFPEKSNDSDADEGPLRKICVSEGVVKFLNNDTYLEALLSLCSSNKLVNPKQLKVLDLCSFPYFGLYSTQRYGVQTSWVARNEEDAKTLGDFLKSNCRSIKCFSIIEDVINKQEELGPYDVIVIDILEPKGEFLEDYISSLPILSTLLAEGGSFIPNALTIWCQLVSSEWVVKCSEVNDADLEKDFKLPNIINKYKVSELIDLNMSAVPHVEMSTKFPITTIQLEDLCNDHNFLFEAQVKISKNGPVNAVIYWFEFDVGKFHISSMQPDSHINQAAQVLDKELIVKENDIHNLELLYYRGILRFNLNS